MEAIIDILEKIEVSPKNEQFNTATIVKFIKDYRGKELKTWDISFATGTSTQPMDLGGGINYHHPVRKFSLENNGKIFKMSGSKRRLGTSSDATYGLEDSEVKAIKAHLNKQNPAQKDYFVNIKRNPLLTIYVVELGDGVTLPLPTEFKRLIHIKEILWLDLVWGFLLCRIVKQNMRDTY